MIAGNERLREFVQSPGLGVKVLIGGLLSFLPIINLFAWGYLYRYAAQLRTQDNGTLPEWKDAAGLFIDGLKFFVIGLLWWTLPVFLVWLGALLLSFITLGLLSPFAFLFVTLAMLLFTPLTVSALILFQRKGGQWACLLDWRAVVRPVQRTAADLLLPVLAFAGLLAVGSPLYGFAIFIGTAILLVFQIQIFTQAFRRKRF